MNKGEAIDQAFRIATLTEPTDEIRSLLRPLEFERVLELLLMLRMSSKPVRNPAGFLRRAVQEGWVPGQLPEKVDRKLENAEERWYINRGYTPEQAREKVLADRNKDVWER